MEGPGQVWFSLQPKFNSFELDSEVGRLVIICCHAGHEDVYVMFVYILKFLQNKKGPDNVLTNVQFIGPHFTGWSHS